MSEDEARKEQDGSNGLPTTPPPRFERRWRLVGAGLSNVWRFGDLDLHAASGRLLLRGMNGKGKTTALEALAPYLLDLNSGQLSAGKSRTTTLSSLMREGAGDKRRIGYAWLTLTERKEGTWSFGVRIIFTEGGSPSAKVIPFTIPGRPLHELQLYGDGRSQLSIEQFSEAVVKRGGQIFESEQSYVSHLAARLFGISDVQELPNLTARLRQIRNPALLSDVSARAAETALRESLPGIAEDVVAATADALVESETTRTAFSRDKEAAEILEEFQRVWSAHACEVVSKYHSAAAEAAKDARSQQGKVRTLKKELDLAKTAASQAEMRIGELEKKISDEKSTISALEKLQAYQDAGRLAELKKSAAAQSRAANSAASAMQATAREAATQASSLQRDLVSLREDLSDCETKAKSADVRADRGMKLLTWHTNQREVMRAGDVTANPGLELIIHFDSGALRDTISFWTALTKEHADRAEAASLAIVDFKKSVELLVQKAVDSGQTASRAQEDADRSSAKAKRAEAAAEESAFTHLHQVRAWALLHPVLTEEYVLSGEVEPCVEPAWGVEEVDQLGTAEPGQILSASGVWARHVNSRALIVSGDFLGRAKSEHSECKRLREEAEVLRMEAEKLRSGNLLSLPRPDWAGLGDDSVVLGAALEWRENFDDPRDRALLESAMSAAGLLGATLSETGASTSFWQVHPTGPFQEINLADYVAVDPSHQQAETAIGVLKRVRVASSALIHRDEGVLCIGLDGTFSAGVLHGRVPGADDASILAQASHVGAIQRRTAAITRAQQLDEEAFRCETAAKLHQDTAHQYEISANAELANARSFPSYNGLQGAESHRVALSNTAYEAQEAALKANADFRIAELEAERVRLEWSERTRARGLPIDTEKLKQMSVDECKIADELGKAATLLREKVSSRLEQAFRSYSLNEISERLSIAEGAAQEAHRSAFEAFNALNVLEEMGGAAIKDVLARHDKSSQELRSAEAELGPARAMQIKKAEILASARSNFTEAERKEREESQPKAAQCLAALHSLLTVHGVSDAVLDGERLAEGGQLIDQIGRKIEGRKTLTAKILLERVDNARAKLAGIWSLDPSDSHGELLTFVLTYRDGTYTPIEAALEAEKLKERAELALAASEERALREFVIGRLPNAIGTAWTRLKDWEVTVNRKMREAAASSGVGVQVRLPLSGDMPPTARDVFELTTKVSEADRTPEQQIRLGEALQSLLAAANGESMLERVKSAVDIRDWVDVHYEVMRPGGTKQRLNSRTSLSGGERRLVALAPMLAAIAANFDRFDSNALRILMLDEVPAEVDEIGREGLARYIAELDLDLLCTSHLWDGCPGAWDGIDAYDLEAGPDGSIVAFPMLVRGLIPIPEREELNLSNPESGG